MKNDIQNIADITTIVNTFYSKALNDSIIGYIFKNTTGFSFEKHLPIIISFWDNVLLDNTNYTGNAMLKHIELNKTIPLQSQHFKQWLTLWETAVTPNFEGTKATLAISKAKSIAAIMQLKINNINTISKIH
jgi:hemoglobin